MKGVFRPKPLQVNFGKISEWRPFQNLCDDQPQLSKKIPISWPQLYKLLGFDDFKRLITSVGRQALCRIFTDESGVIKSGLPGPTNNGSTYIFSQNCICSRLESTTFNPLGKFDVYRWMLHPDYCTGLCPT